MTPTPLPIADALVGVVAGWWAPTGAHRVEEPAHRMTRSQFTGNRGQTALCGLSIVHAGRVPDGSTARRQCPACAVAAARISRHDAVSTSVKPPAPTLPRAAVRPASTPGVNTAAARAARRFAFRNSFMSSERARSYAAAPYDPPSAALAAAARLPVPS
ncbi:hypothetical protein GCM10009613_60690 [Pseudonocardia kongjuensis]|uniref:Uncharacterized protein n=1 Tax=Pseudonocardia kongjuensis TaxID=102227 RepID=A0ABP4IZE5_9PSEU